jgi:hypothetical protein
MFVRRAQRGWHRSVYSYLDKFPGDPAFAPVFDELNRRRAFVFFHPAHSSCCRNLTSQSGMIDYGLDTTRAISGPLDALKDLVPVSQILCGSDVPTTNRAFF